MESLKDNKKYFKLLLIALATSLLLSFNVIEDLNEMLELTFKGLPESVIFISKILWFNLFLGSYRFGSQAPPDGCY